MLITTTSQLDGCHIKNYVGRWVVPIVGAGNVVRDWFAGFTDLFGGNSSGYQRAFAKFIEKGVSEMMDPGPKITGPMPLPGSALRQPIFLQGNPLFRLYCMAPL